MIKSPLAAAFNVSVPVVLFVKATVDALLEADPSVAVIENEPAQGGVIRDGDRADRSYTARA